MALSNKQSTMDPATNSIASSAPDQRQLRLIAAAAQLNEARIRDILSEDPNSWTSATDRDALRQSLQKVAARGKLDLVRLLLSHGADPDAKPGRDNEIPAVFKAAEGGHAAIITELIARGADANWKHARTGQTALFAAACRSHVTAMGALLDGGASIEIRDKDGRTPLLYLASDKKAGKCSAETLKLLVDRGADLEVRDPISRTPLVWAATTGNLKLLDIFTSGCLGRRADMTATNNRGRTALHLAAEQNHPEMVRLLLERGADPSAVSDGGWTALHNAAQGGHTDVIALLLQARGVDVNAELNNGMTPLHWAAFNGHEAAVVLLLDHKDTKVDIKDGFYRTPLLCAAEKRHGNIVQLLSPARAASRLSDAARRACESFQATVVDFGDFRDGKKQLVFKPSVFELLYGWDHENDKPTIPTSTKNIKYEPSFRWIHLPANNLAWVETLVSKFFIENGHRDIEAFKSLERCFDQEHCGPFAHANFMRTFAARIPAIQNHGYLDREEKTLVALSEDTSEVTIDSPRPDKGYISPTKPPRSDTSSTKPISRTDTGTTAKSDKKKSKGEQFVERHGPAKKRARGPPGNAPGTKARHSSLSLPLPWENSRLAAPSGRMILFMPFLHYETNERRKKMTAAIKLAESGAPLPPNPCCDELLIHGYINNNPPLHPRRTLDQFFYHGIDTTLRDEDQVVYRYCKLHRQEIKVFMVDQLWLWVLSRDLVITCFPQRWDQPKLDPLNMLDGIIEETNAKTRPPVQTVYDLAMLITNRCAGLFDRHRLDSQEFQFLDIFESSVGRVTNRESELFVRFNRASELSGRLRKKLAGRAPRLDNDRDPADELLDIGSETELLAEIKDIRDELNILHTVLNGQLIVLDEFERHITDEVRASTAADPSARRTTDMFVADCKRRSKDQRRLLETHLEDIVRINRQSESIYHSLTNLLDLKQKHSNALEARFARDQAVIAARQGQTVMVFTLVTIVFLPMSFIAAFFAINFREWQDSEGQPGLSIGFASKYMFGIGLGISIPLIIVAFTVTDVVDSVQGFVSNLARPKSKPEDPQPEVRRLSTRHQQSFNLEMNGPRRKAAYTGLSPPPSAGSPISPMPSPYNAHRLSHPIQGTGYRPRSGSGISWAPRSSFDRRKADGDLERGGYR
ncbi:hypothetical protein MCOR25_009260 [Pyricularia grisea]|nr:hypothetical protein MCOR25_009260 [Pyricularia grisea]